MKVQMASTGLKVRLFENGEARVLAFAKGTVTIGAASHCDVPVKEPSVGNEHVRVWCENGRIWIQDLGHTPGSFLNDIPLPPLKPMLMRDRDVLKIGESGLTFGFEAGSKRPTEGTEPPVPAKFELPPAAGEAEVMSRELADLRLRLQMVELAQPVSEAMDSALTEAQETIVQLEKEKARLRREADDQLQDLKLRSLKDLKDQEVELEQRFLTWRRNAVSELNWIGHVFFERKVKAVLTPEARAAHLAAWQEEWERAFKTVVLDEKATENRQLEESRRILAAAKNSSRWGFAWSEIGLGAAIVALTGTLVFLTFFRARHVPARSVASVPCQPLSR